MFYPDIFHNPHICSEEQTHTNGHHKTFCAWCYTGAWAVKLKVGGRMTSEESVPGRTKAIIPLARKTFGDGITIYADANGSY